MSPGYDLVLLPGFSRRLQRHLGLHLRCAPCTPVLYPIGAGSDLSSSGMIWGKTPLIKLSPKKTVEGFTGAFFCTLIFAYLVSAWSLPAPRSGPRADDSFSPFSGARSVWASTT